jgi:two-component system phosphate regulon sensor histidine kinase PhoR
MKNATQKSVALLVSAVLSFLLVVFLILLRFSYDKNLPIYLLFLIPLVVFGISYPLVYFTVEEFIYRRVKLIYKIINDLKTGKDVLRDKLESPNILDDVKEQVIEFSLKKSAEIEELKKLEKYRRDFLGNVSHELKTPIFNIQGYLETLLDGGLDDPRIAREYVERAAKNADRLGNIVEDLLLISQYEEGELELYIERFDIHQLTKDVFDSLKMQAELRDIRLQFKEECNQPFFVEADKSRISQVLYNLITNAIKYGREHGYVFAGFYVMDDKLLIEISDNGPGIEQHHLSRLFERFYRVDKARSREAGGTGLGLSIVKHIVEAHGEKVHVRSTVGIGTTFGFTLKKSK